MATIHGYARKTGRCPEYNAWAAMKARCTNENHKQYSNYGGRGITVCDEWLTCFGAFIAHMGLKPSPLHTLDRIDVNGNYEPGNVRWATNGQQQVNKRMNKTLTIGQETLCVAAWAKRSGLHHQTIRQRMRLGWPDADCVLRPKRQTAAPKS